MNHGTAGHWSQESLKMGKCCDFIIVDYGFFGTEGSPFSSGSLCSLPLTCLFIPEDNGVQGLLQQRSWQFAFIFCVRTY